MYLKSSADRVAQKYHLRTLVREICSSKSFRNRSASLQDFTPKILEAFGEAFLFYKPNIKVAFFRGLRNKLKQLWDLMRKAPQLWQKIKSFLNTDVKNLPEVLKGWAKKGIEFLRKILRKIFLNNPFAAMYVIPKHKMPGVTDMLARITNSSPKLKSILSTININIILPIEEIIKKNPLLAAASRPLMAAVFILIWLNVAEISWDFESLVMGFTGGLPLGELLASLPESGFGFLIVLLFPGIGTFALLPLAIMARLTYLLIKKIIIWIKGKGFIVDWKKLGIPGGQKELIPATI